MKVVILAGGLGWRLSDDNELRPKPMTEVGNRPILWHIMRFFAHQGHNEFVVALGQRGEYVKRYMIDYCTIGGDVLLDTERGTVEQANQPDLAWKVQLVDTGLKTQTGGRLKRLAGHLGQDPFLLTYGDCLSDLDVDAFIGFHRARGRLATVAAVRPPARYGAIDIDDHLVVNFGQQRLNQGWISGGIFVFEAGALDYIDGDRDHLELEPLARLSRDYHLAAYRHHGFWQCIDTMRDKRMLDELWERGQAPWRVWPRGG